MIEFQTITYNEQLGAKLQKNSWNDYTASYIFEVKKISNELMDEGRILGSEIKKHLKWEQYIYYLFIYLSVALIKLT